MAGGFNNIELVRDVPYYGSINLIGQTPPLTILVRYGGIKTKSNCSYLDFYGSFRKDLPSEKHNDLHKGGKPVSILINPPK
jgi:hypothetical protein